MTRADFVAQRAHYKLLIQDRARLFDQLHQLEALPWYKRLFLLSRMRLLRAEIRMYGHLIDHYARLLWYWLKCPNPCPFN